MNAELQTKVQASPAQNFTPVQTGLLQRKSALYNTPGLVENSKRDKEKLTLQRSSIDLAGTTTVPRFGHDFSRVSVHSTGPGMIQTKLKINEPGDIYEQEADRVADAVMQMPGKESGVLPLRFIDKAESSGFKVMSHSIPTKVQDPTSQIYIPSLRFLEEVPAAREKKEEEEMPVQRKVVSNSQHSAAPPIIQNVLHSYSQPLNPATRAFMEPRFGHDLSLVRVHTDAQAEESALAVNARAFTVGQDVVFGSGQYAPETTDGKHLIAHELTHVIQQNSSNHNISPETKEPAESIFNGVSKGKCVQVRQKKPAGISLAVLEENSTDRSQQSELERILGFDNLLINEIESLAIGSDNKQWRSQDLNRIGRLALKYMDASQIRALSDKLEIPSESEVREAATETTTEGVIQRDAVAAGAVAGTMWWLTLIDGPLPFGDVAYAAMIVIAAVAVTTAKPQPTPQEVPIPEEVTPPGKVIPIESHPRYKPHFKEPIPEPKVSRPTPTPIPWSEPSPYLRRPRRRRNKCKETNPTYIDCDIFQDKYEEAAKYLSVQNIKNVNAFDLGTCSHFRTIKSGKIEACNKGPCETWHCTVKGTRTPLSIFGCYCCEEDGSSSICWRSPHWSEP